MPSTPRGAPGSVSEATESVLAGLRWLANADLGSVPASVHGDCLRSLEQFRSVFTAAHASVLSAFCAGGGFEADGQGSARSWLRWQTQVTGAAASASSGWMRRLKSHEAVRDALGDGRISVSWARHICDWTDLLPEAARGDADLILLAAAEGGAELADLARLAEEMRRRLAPADGDGPGFEDRQLRLQATLGGAGRLEGDLTPRCAEAVRAVLDALGKRAGPEDTRTRRQRHHDALEEACRRLLAAGGLPDRAGQPAQLQLHISLDELTRRLSEDSQRQGSPGSPDADASPDDGPGPAFPAGSAFPSFPAFSAGPRGSANATGRVGEPVLPGATAMAGDECDATIAPIVTGRVDQDLLDQLTALLTRPLPGTSRPREDGQRDVASGGGEGGGNACGGDSDGGSGGEAAWMRGRVRELITANAVALLSGPGGLASALRTRPGHIAPGPVMPVSVPLDLGKPTETIPPSLRRAVIARDRHCAAPGCQQPPAACQVHHLTPRSRGGPTSLGNLLLLCTFHHLIAVHQWGWRISLNADGTTTMRSPDGSRVYHSHSPPAVAA